MSDERWDKDSFLKAVPEEFKDVSEEFIERVGRDYDIEWSKIKIEKKPQLTARPWPKYPFLQYCATDPHIWLKAHLMDRPGYPFYKKLRLIFDHFKDLYDPEYPEDKSMQVKLKKLKNNEQFELFIHKLSEFKELISSGENQIMQMNSTESEPAENHSEEAIQIPASNLILYGPPGTGKTYELQQRFAQYTSETDHEKREIYLQRIVSGKPWFQVVAAAILDLGKAKVPELLKHELIQARFLSAKTSNKSQTLWAALQIHSCLDCPNVQFNPERRSGPLIFWKDEDGAWRIKDTAIEDVPEATELLLISGDKPKAEIVQRFEFITFHQSYSYEEFIEGIRPVMDNSVDPDNNITYRIEDGIFKRICGRASRDPENNYALFIDEINRGNISKIFGELITLVELDKRLGAENELQLTLPYSKEKFGVPKNLSIIGTMNTADRSIALVDIALRRRFEFVEMMPDTQQVSDHVEGINARALMQTINRRIECLYDRDHVIGHADFMGVPNLDALRTKFLKKIIPLLQEYFYGDWGKICLVLGCPADDDGVQQNPNTAIIQSNSLGLGYYTDQYEGNSVAFTINPQFRDAKDSDLKVFFSRILNGR